MDLQEFKDKADGYIAMVLDNQLTKDDAGDAINDCLSAVAEDEQEEGYDYYSQQWVKWLMNGESK